MLLRDSFGHDPPDLTQSADPNVSRVANVSTGGCSSFVIFLILRTMGAQSVELLLSYLTAQYLRIPLVCVFCA